MKREDALMSIAEIFYPSVEDLGQYIAYSLKKMGWTINQFEDYIKRPERAHSLYPSEKALYDFCFRLYEKILRGSCCHILIHLNHKVIGNKYAVALELKKASTTLLLCQEKET